MDFNPVADAKFIRQPAAVWAVKSRGVGFIYHQPCAIFFLQYDDFSQRGGIAIHAEDRLGDDEHASFRRAEQAFEQLDQVMNQLLGPQQ